MEKLEITSMSSIYLSLAFFGKVVLIRLQPIGKKENLL